MEAHDTPAWVLLAYLVSGICFILALRGLSSPVSSRRGNRAGMIGMAIAVITTLAVHEIASLPEILVAIAIGGGIGLVAVALASVNIFGGFAVTARMLAMYKKKER